MLLHKNCTICEVEMPADGKHFYAHPSCSHGLDSACRKCRNQQRQAWKKRNIEKVLARRRELYAEKYGERQRELERIRFALHPLRVQAERLMSGCRERSRKLGFEVPPELRQKSFFVDWLKRQPNCGCCGVQFLIGPKNGEWNDNSPSIDRFDSTIGYSLRNIALICWRCNNIKRNYSSHDLRLVAAWMDTWGNETGKFNLDAA
jgi:hypothetical protein